MSKFSSVRDEILWSMANDLWANESDGNVECPSTGWFARITNNVEDIVSIIDAFAEDAFKIDPSFDMSTLIGHFLLIESELGFVYVTEYPTEAALIADYRELEARFAEWDNN